MTAHCYTQNLKGCRLIPCRCEQLEAEKASKAQALELALRQLTSSEDALSSWRQTAAQREEQFKAETQGLRAAAALLEGQSRAQVRHAEKEASRCRHSAKHINTVLQ